MTKLNEVYKCGVCGNMVEVVHAAGGELVCCGEPMALLRENTVDAAKEKHVPVIEVRGRDVLVKVGSVAHPMADDHYIEFIELIADGQVCRRQLKPGMAPEATFGNCGGAQQLAAREYCNKHGLWQA